MSPAQTVFHLSSKYAGMLFQHVASLANLDRINSKTFTMVELRTLLGVIASDFVTSAGTITSLWMPRTLERSLPTSARKWERFNGCRLK